MTINQQLAEIRKSFIEKINDFESAFKKFHSNESRNARRRGMREGNKNKPASDAESLSSTEKEIATAYAAQLAELSIDFGGYLEQVKKDHLETISLEINKLKVVGISSEISNLQEKKQKDLSQIEDEYHRKISILDEDPKLRNLQQNLDDIDDQLDELYEVINRRHTNVMMQIQPFWYYFLLVFVGFAEIAATYNAFLNFEEPPVTTLIWALGVGATISIGSHFVGLGYSIGREKKAYLAISTLIAMGIFLALFFVSKVRAESMADIPVKHISFEAFIAISLAVFMIGILLSFFTHDSNPTLSHLLSKYHEYQKTFQESEKSIFTKKQEILNNMQMSENAIHERYDKEINSMENSAQVLDHLYNEAISLHDEILLGLINMEKYMLRCFDRCLQEYRSANAEHRESKDPAYWSKNITLRSTFSQVSFLHENKTMKGLWHYNPN